jgi:hypothetical protein
MNEFIKMFQSVFSLLCIIFVILELKGYVEGPPVGIPTLT